MLNAELLNAELSRITLEHIPTKYAGELHNVATGTTENSTAAAVGK